MQKNMSGIISVIVPVYNTELYLRECIESLIGQTICNYEIILIDDGSEDDSKNICDYYSGIYKNIHAFHKKNGGLSSARNMGIGKARGDYIAFVDSDDIVAPNFLEELYCNAIRYDADIVQTAFFRISANGKKVGGIVGKSHTIIDGKTCLERLAEGQDIGYAVIWNKLYRKELWKNISFPQGRIHEDMFVNYKLYDRAQKVILLPYGLYGYRIRPDSITMTMNQNDNLDFWEALIRREHFLLNRELTDIYCKHLRYKIAFVKQNFRVSPVSYWQWRMLKDYVYDVYILYKKERWNYWNKVSYKIILLSILWNVGFEVKKLINTVIGQIAVWH